MTAVAVPELGSKPLRALIVGLGSIGQRHARNLRTMLGDRVELFAFRSRRQSFLITDGLGADRTRGPEEEYKIRSFVSLDEALRVQPHVAFICNPTSLHIEMAIRCANAGCDLFIEKPISHSMARVGELVRLVNERGLVAAVGCQLRFHPCLRHLRSAILSGAIGRPLCVRAEVGEFLPGWHPFEDYRQGYAARRDLGGGVILTLIHDVDYLLWLFGMPSRLYAVGGHLSSLDVDVEDVASVLMHCGTVDAPLPVHLQLDYVRRPARRICTVLGDDGWAELDLRLNHLSIADATGDERDRLHLPDLDRNELFIEELRDFLMCQNSRTSPVVGLRDGMAALSVALAAHESIASSRAVEIE
jgi:predicted dehydrogenase